MVQNELKKTIRKDEKVCVMGDKSKLEALFSLVPFLEPYPAWVKIIICCWIVLTAVLFMCILFTRPSSKNEPLAEKKPASVSEQKQDFVPLIDIELLTTMIDEHNFAYEIIVHNKSNVPISHITILRRVLAKRNQKMAIRPSPKIKLKSQVWKINALKAGESKKIHTERSESYQQATFDITYLDEYHNRYIAGFEGDRDGLTLKKSYKHEKEKRKKIQVQNP